jgi:hypothetical protein
MVNRPKAIGTAAETAVVRALRVHGFPHAERRALTGSQDQGDITGCPGVVWEVKGGQAARDASDHQIAVWLAETEVERINANATVGVLVVQRAGVGPANAHRWWAVMRLDNWVAGRGTDAPMRLLLADACELLRWAGYGEPLPNASAVIS